MIRGITFDLDDTLYPEILFVKSGMRAVAESLDERGYCSSELAFETMLGIHMVEGRDAVINKAADRLRLPPSLIPSLVDAYRDHQPQGLVMYPEVPETLTVLRQHYRLGVITDGWHRVQERKVAAIGIGELVDLVYLTDEFGRTKWKPDPFPFHECGRRLGVGPDELLHVGDNPERDVAGAIAAGAQANLIRREGGYFSGAPIEVSVPVISSLSELLRLVD